MLERTQGIEGIGGFGSGPRPDAHPRPRAEPSPAPPSDMAGQPPPETSPGDAQQSIRSLASRLEALQGELAHAPSGDPAVRREALRRIAEVQISMANLAGAGVTPPSSEQVSKAVSALAATLRAPEGSRVLTLLEPKGPPEA